MSLIRGKTNNTFDVISGDFNGESLPVGIMGPWPSDTIPYGWLLCDGQAVSRTDYADLFAVLGTSHGSGDGTTTFNVPDMRDYTVVGKSSTDTNIDTIGKKYGAKTHTLTIAQMPAHNHALGIKLRGITTGSSENYNTAGLDRETTIYNVIDESGGGQAHNNMQPSIAENYIIKAKQSSGVIANVVDDLDSTSTIDALSANQGRVLNERTIYDSGSNANGSYIRFNDGTMICTLKIQKTNVQTTVAYGNVFVSEVQASVNYPVPFVELYSVTSDLNGAGSVNMIGEQSLSESDMLIKTRKFFFQGAVSADSFTGYVMFTAIGRWK